MSEQHPITPPPENPPRDSQPPATESRVAPPLGAQPQAGQTQAAQPQAAQLHATQPTGTQPHATPASSGPYFAAQPPASYLPAAPSPRRGGFSRGFGLGAGAGLGAGLSLLVLGLVGSVISALMMAGFAAAALGGAGQTAIEPQRTVWGPATAKHTIRAIDVSGVIQNDASDGAALTAGTYGYEIADVLDDLDADDADAVVLLMNTPGGAIPGSRAMGEAVERYQSRTGKKLFAFVQGMSASGGMFAMAGADEIVADHGSAVGSVGVISGPFFVYRDVTEVGSTIFEAGVTTRGGITGEYFTAGKGKDFGSPWRQMTTDERAEYQGLLDHEYSEFVAWVSRHRGIPEATLRDELGAGLFGTAQAEKVGYIDAVMTREDAFRHFAEVAGLDPDSTKVVAPEQPGFLMQMLGAQARVYGHAPAVKPEGNQPARATASFCTSMVPMAVHGSLAAACG